MYAMMYLRESNTLTTNRALAFGVPLLILVMLYALASINVIYILSSNFETYTDELASVLTYDEWNYSDRTIYYHYDIVAWSSPTHAAI